MTNKKPAKTGNYSKPLQAAQIDSYKNDFSTSGIGGGFNSTFPIIRWSTSSDVNSPDLISTLNVSIVATSNLCLSNKPLRVF